MMISKQEARAALTEAETAARRSREIYGYSRSAPYCFIWGAAWFLGYMGQAVLSGAQSAWTWPIALLGGAGACALVGLSQKRRDARPMGRVWLLFVVIYAFSFSLFAVFRPTGLEIGAYWPLLCAALYAGVGLWGGIRYVIVGAALAVLTLFGFFALRDQFYVVMAIAGGGSLVLTGLWLRRA
jgi:hypothetical protein